MSLSFYKSPISQEIRNEGKVQATAVNILVVFTARGMDVPQAVRERIIGCDNLGTLRRWHRRAVTVLVAEDIFIVDRDRPEYLQEVQAAKERRRIARIFEALRMDVPEAVRERILGCRDVDTLRRWTHRALEVSAAEDIFAADGATDE